MLKMLDDGPEVPLQSGASLAVVFGVMNASAALNYTRLLVNKEIRILNMNSLTKLPEKLLLRIRIHLALAVTAYLLFAPSMIEALAGTAVSLGFYVLHLRHLV